MSVMGALADLTRGNNVGALPEDAQYDPFTGMPIPSASVQQAGPSTADAYRMGGLANMVPSQTGSILEHTYPTPPEQVFAGYDKAVVNQEKAQRRAQAEAEFFGPRQAPMMGQEASHAPNKLIEALAPSTLTDVGMMFGTGPLGRAAAVMGATFDPSAAEAGKTKLPLGALGRAAKGAEKGVANWKLGDVAAQEPKQFNVAAPGAMSAEQLDTAREYTKRYAPVFKMGGDVNAGLDAPTNRLIQTVRSPHRMMFPGVYANPREIAAEAARHIVPEDPIMKQLWGVTRGDLDAMAVGRVGNEAPRGVNVVANPKGSESATNVMTPRNEQRLQDALYEAGLVPGIKHADAWYIMDPLYHRLEQMFGPEEAVRRYRHLNTMTGMASPSSPVLQEIQRGTGAHWLEQQGRFEDVNRFFPLGKGERAKLREQMGADYPSDLDYIKSHLHFRNAAGDPMAKYLQRGELLSDKPKVPLYVHASGVPQTGFQTTAPVGDAHWSRSVGLADTREGPSNVAAAFTRPEYQQLSPWWQHRIAAPLGLESVPAQARMWTVMGPQTGIDSPLGAGKLELFSQQIAKAAKRLGISPENARDLILSGGAGAGALMLAPQMGGLAAQDQYSQ
jgi:hypothetical protein